MHIVHTRREFVSGASHLAIAAVCMQLAVRERWARVALGTVVADARRPYPLSRRPTMRECPHCGTRRSSCRPTPAASIWVHERFSWCRGRATRPSDVSIEVDDPSLVFCGNLVWNGIFPNYVDAAPSALTPSVKALRRPGQRRTFHYTVVWPTRAMWRATSRCSTRWKQPRVRPERKGSRSPRPPPPSRCPNR